MEKLTMTELVSSLTLYREEAHSMISNFMQKDLSPFIGYDSSHELPIYAVAPIYETYSNLTISVGFKTTIQLNFCTLEKLTTFLESHPTINATDIHMVGGANSGWGVTRVRGELRTNLYLAVDLSVRFFSNGEPRFSMDLHSAR